jgi:hypothetical protein
VDPQTAYGGAHVKEQLVPSHDAVPFAGGAHAVQEVVPHELTDELLTHAPLQS